jgi:hypothetical protein
LATPSTRTAGTEDVRLRTRVPDLLPAFSGTEVCGDDLRTLVRDHLYLVCGSFQRTAVSAVDEHPDALASQ